MAMRDKGLVNQVFDEQKLRALRGEMAVGHVRYSTTGANSWENTQPVWRADRREVALAHNGNLVNAVELHGELRGAGVTFRSTSDSEIIAALLSTHPAERIEDAVADVMAPARGRLLDRRDDEGPRRRLPRSRRPAAALARHARRPLLRRLRDLRVRHHRRALPARRPAGRGRLALRRAGSRRGWPSRASATRCACSSTSTSRGPTRGSAARCCRSRAAGWARSSPARRPSTPTSSSRCPTPGNAAARGYARASGLPQDDGFVKNRYVARTFIQPGQELRKHGLRMKFNPLPEVVAGKRLVVVDDSIVRGNTTRQIVQMLRDAGRERGAHAHLARRRSAIPATTGSTCRRARR